VSKISENIASIVDAIANDYDNSRPIDKTDLFSQPDSDAIYDIIGKLMRIAFPGYYVDKDYKIYNIKTTIAAVIEDVTYNLNKQIVLALRYDKELQDKSAEELAQISEEKTVKFMQLIPQVREYLDTDIEALFIGDPAAESKEVIIMCYPGLYAIAVQRFAHVLYQLNVPMIPRMMTEHAHSLTGIDINPGATIGKYFFIDHGTGIVIGETTEIGEHVKLYQGVTLGALSTRAGRGLVDKKRHPTIEDNVTIYSGASILGGDTVIGHDSVIGGNVFLTKSIPSNTKVNVQSQELRFDGQKVNKIDSSENSEWFYVI
jgi:Serine acetyltransferase